MCVGHPEVEVWRAVLADRITPGITYNGGIWDNGQVCVKLTKTEKQHIHIGFTEIYIMSINSKIPLILMFI